MASPFLLCDTEEQSPYYEHKMVVKCANGESFTFTPVPFSFLPSCTQMAKEVKLFPTSLVQVEEIDEMMKRDKNKVFLDFMQSEPV
eukprot:3345594-Rhodomonas_salina.1